MRAQYNDDNIIFVYTLECVETQIGNRNSKQQAQDNKIYEICILFPNLNPFADARNGKYNNIQKRYYVPLKLIWQLIAAATKCICSRITPSKFTAILAQELETLNWIVVHD